MIRGIRGATTVNSNLEEEIIINTKLLLQEMIMCNEIYPENVASILISVTEDITAAFPAKALRLFQGWSHVPVMCMREIPVPGSLDLCIRIMMNVNTEKHQNEINHIYLRGAKVLRPDLLKHDQEVSN